MIKKNYPLLVLGIVILLVLWSFLTKENAGNSTPPQPNTNKIGQNMTAEPLASASASTKLLTLHLFFVALSDNGQNGEKIGCSDSIAPVNIVLPETPTPLQAVMQQLLLIKQQTVGPSKLYNSLYQSNLQFKDASIKNGVATIHLTGSIKLAGECDNPRFQSQLEKTAAQFSNVNSVQIFVNDKPLSEAISLK